MTRKDFELIAKAVRESNLEDDSLGDDPNYSDRGSKKNVAWILADALAETNPRFDRERFVRACVEEVF